VYISGVDSSTRTAVVTFLIAAIVCGVLYAIAVPPFAGPDEKSHFLRAWWVSEGHVLALRDGHRVGFMLPADVVNIREPFAASSTADRADIRAGLRAPAAHEPRVFHHDPDHAIASVLPYIPQGLGIALGRAFGVSPLLCAYFGRWMNLIAGIALIAFAVRLLPAYRWLLIVLALTPMSNYLRVTLSGDVVTIALSYLFIALAARALFLDEGMDGGMISPRLWAAITIAGGLLCLTKVTYIPLAMLPLAVPSRRFASNATAWRARAIQAGVAIVAAFVSSRIASYYWEPFRDDVTAPREQFAYILGHPLAFVKVLYLEHVVHARWYLVSMIGDLGSAGFTIVLPKLLVLFCLLAMLALLILDTNPRVHVTPLQRVYTAVLCAGSTFAIALAIYTTWNLVGADHIDGLQGRYYLPFVPAAAFIVHRAVGGLAQRWRMATAIAAAAIVNAVALNIILHQWYR
jgi:uncharacterized membrane protein